MPKSIHGAVTGIIFGAVTPLLAWSILRTTFTSNGTWNWGGYFTILVIYAALGAIVGTVLPKHK